MDAVVYWIRTNYHQDIMSEGYVGVTTNFDRRIKSHFLDALKQKHRNYKLQEAIQNEDDIIVDIVFSGEEDECYAYESKFRPDYNIAWNILPGGKTGAGNAGRKMSEEFCKHRSELMIGNTIAKANKGKPKSEEHKEKISKANKGKPKSEEQKINHSKTMTGRKYTDEHKEKIRLAALGKKRGPYKKQNG